MKPAPFGYRVPADLDQARLWGSEAGWVYVAGNQSLGPLLNLRLTRPAGLVDLWGAEALRTVEDQGALVRIGAGWTHAEIEDGDLPDPTPGWLRAAAGGIAYRAVRSRGTLGGSLAHADPAADWLIVLTALGTSVAILDGTGTRTVPLSQFVTGPFQTLLRPGDILAAVLLPRPGSGARFSYAKFCRQVGAFALASAAVLDDPAQDRQIVALGALGGAPRVLSAQASAAVVAGRLSPSEAVATMLPDRADHALHVTMLAQALAGLATGEPMRS